MLRYECDFCHRLKEKGESWILGFAAENIGVTARKREVTILPQWDELRAVGYLAVHLCSEQCRQNYMESLFGEESSEAETTEEVIPRKRVVREYPGATVETKVVRRKASRGPRRAA